MIIYNTNTSLIIRSTYYKTRFLNYLFIVNSKIQYILSPVLLMKISIIYLFKSHILTVIITSCLPDAVALYIKGLFVTHFDSQTMKCADSAADETIIPELKEWSRHYFSLAGCQWRADAACLRGSLNLTRTWNGSRSHQDRVSGWCPGDVPPGRTDSFNTCSVCLPVPVLGLMGC